MSRKPPIDKDVFEEKTSLLVEVIAKTCLNERRVPGEHVSPEQCQRFIDQSDVWVRWLYSNNSTWKRNIDSKKDDGNYGRDFVYMFVEHWADAFIADPDSYLERRDIAHLPIDTC